MSGAKMPISATSSTRLPYQRRFYYEENGVTSVALLSHTRVRYRLKDIKQQVKYDKQNADQKHIGLDDRIVPVKNGTDAQGSQSLAMQIHFPPQWFRRSAAGCSYQWLQCRCAWSFSGYALPEWISEAGRGHWRRVHSPVSCFPAYCCGSGGYRWKYSLGIR